MGTITTINPATGEKIQSYSLLTPQELEQKLLQARSTQQEWKNSSLTDREHLLRKIAAHLLHEKEALAKLAQEEMGKPLAQGISEVEKCAAAANYYAENLERFLAPEMVATEAKKSFICFEPLGTVLAVMPWNFPYWQVFRCALPAIAAGNTVLLKHASNVAGAALACEKIFQSVSGKALFQTLLIPSNQVASVIANSCIQAVSFTGSTEVGKEIASVAGAHLKKAVLELGGSDAYVVLADADLDHAVARCAESRLINSGQSCINAKRFIVEEKIYEDFCQKLARAMEKIEIGPLAREDLREELQNQVDRSIKMGATPVIGGNIPKGKGSFYPATLLMYVTPEMPAFREELFGPVAAVVRAANESEAIRLANESRFGLGAAVFTKNLEKGERIAVKELEAGSCFVNTFVRSDPRLPFGGIKDSGIGRELSYYGLKEFVNIKTIYVQDS